MRLPRNTMPVLVTLIVVALLRYLGAVLSEIGNKGVAPSVRARSHALNHLIQAEIVLERSTRIDSAPGVTEEFKRKYRDTARRYATSNLRLAVPVLRHETLAGHFPTCGAVTAQDEQELNDLEEEFSRSEKTATPPGENRSSGKPPAPLRK
jgi:hypothetical protein